MQVNVKKFLFIGTSEIRDSFFKKAQEKGIIHFIKDNDSQVIDYPPDIDHYIHALKIIKNFPQLEQKISNENPDTMIKAFIALHNNLNKSLEQERIIKLDISRIEAFGNFEIKDIEFIKQEANRIIQFYCGRSGYYDHLDLPENLLYISTANGLDYFIGINASPTQYDKLIEMKIDISLHDQKINLKKVQKEIKIKKKESEEYQKYKDFFYHAFIEKINEFSLSSAQKNVNYQLDDALFSVQGWVPKNKISQLKSLAQEFDLFYEEIIIEENDRIPTYLENKGMGKIGEDLIGIYDTPGPEDRDPSLWVLIFFSLFFAFIVGDGGYGLIFLGVALFLRYKYKNAKNLKKRMINLVTILSVCCILWGVLISSFFGISIAPESSIQKFSLVNYLVEKKVEYHQKNQDATFKEWAKKFPDIKQLSSPKDIIANALTEKNGIKNHEMYRTFADGIMLELALMIGMIHIILSFLRNIDKNWAGIGWIVFIIGAYLYFPYYLGTSTMLHYVFGVNESIGPYGLYVLLGGLISAVGFSILQNKIYGILEVMTLIQVFSDILSYLRLYALGLAGGIVSSTINDLAGSVYFLAGIFIIIFGHIINIVLAIMGGVIHGLRLNFLEWYHYSFGGGGKPFKPLRKLEVE